MRKLKIVQTFIVVYFKTKKKNVFEATFSFHLFSQIFILLVCLARAEKIRIFVHNFNNITDTVRGHILKRFTFLFVKFDNIGNSTENGNYLHNNYTLRAIPSIIRIVSEVRAA